MQQMQLDQTLHMHAIITAQRNVYHNRVKHIDIRMCFVRDAIERNRVVIEHVASTDQLADVLTKALGPQKLYKLRNQLVNCAGALRQ